MPTCRYRCTWDQIAYLDADYMASWGAFAWGHRETIDFDDSELPKLAFQMSFERDEFLAVYQWRENAKDRDGPFIQSTICIDRRPCRFGGSRAYFICPCCGRRTLRLAVLSEGLRCGCCGRVTWSSRRERPVQRLLRQATKVALKLGCESWDQSPEKKPIYMRVATYERLLAQRSALVSEINRRLAIKLSRSGLIGQLSYLVRL